MSEPLDPNLSPRNHPMPSKEEMIAALKQGSEAWGLFRQKYDGFKMEEIDLSGADLSGTDLSDISLYDANLSEANLEGCKLHRSALSGANCRGIRLVGADLSEASLYQADLTGADLSGANCWLTNFGETTFVKVTVAGASFFGACIGVNDGKDTDFFTSTDLGHSWGVPGGVTKETILKLGQERLTATVESLLKED